MTGRPRWLGAAAWCLYDWANSAFPTVVTTFVFSVYFTRKVVGDPVEGQAQWSYAVAAAAVLVALGGPALGAIADRMGRRKPWLLAFTLASMAATAALWWVEPTPGHALRAQVLYALAAGLFGFAIVFYDAMLRGIAADGYIGRLSGWGWAVGYAGGLACLVTALFGLIRADPPPFGLAAEASEPIRATALLVAAWFGLFAIPLFVFTPDRPASGVALGRAVRDGVTGLFGSLRRILEHRDVTRFLIANLLYTNGLNTLFSFGGIYAAGTFGLSFEQILYFGIALNVTAGIGAAGFAWLDDRIGPKPTILIALAGLTALGAGLVLVHNTAWFVALGCAMGALVGPAQAAGRSMMARLAPPALETEAFGLFELAGKVTVFIGPLALGIATTLFQSQRAGIATILLFFLGGMLALWPLRPRERG